MPPGSWVVVPEPSRLTKPTSQDSSAQTLNRTDSPHIGQFCTPLPTTALASSFTGMLRSSTMTTHIRPGHRSCQEQLGRTPSVRATGKRQNAKATAHGRTIDSFPSTLQLGVNQILHICWASEKWANLNEAGAEHPHHLLSLHSFAEVAEVMLQDIHQTPGLATTRRYGPAVWGSAKSTKVVDLDVQVIGVGIPQKLHTPIIPSLIHGYPPCASSLSCVCEHFV